MMEDSISRTFDLEPERTASSAIEMGATERQRQFFFAGLGGLFMAAAITIGAWFAFEPKEPAKTQTSTPPRSIPTVASGISSRVPQRLDRELETPAKTLSHSETVAAAPSHAPIVRHGNIPKLNNPPTARPSIHSPKDPLATP